MRKRLTARREDMPLEHTLYDAIVMMNGIWNEFPSSKIRNCWRRTKLFVPDEPAEENAENAEHPQGPIPPPIDATEEPEEENGFDDDIAMEAGEYDEIQEWDAMEANALPYASTEDEQVHTLIIHVQNLEH